MFKVLIEVVKIVKGIDEIVKIVKGIDEIVKGIDENVKSYGYNC